jgi:hypothetical protein
MVAEVKVIPNVLALVVATLWRLQLQIDVSGIFGCGTRRNS